jgi:hypothetical protein
MVLGGLCGVIDGLVAGDPGNLADPATVVELHRQLDRLAAVTARAAAAFDAGGEWRTDGAQTAAAWLAVECNQAKSVVKGEMARGRVLRHLPVTGAAWLAGDISAAHVRVLGAARRPDTAAQMAADEPLLVGYATTLRFHEFATVVAYWSQHVDPDGADDLAGRQRSARSCHLSQSVHGMWFGNVVLDPLSGAVVAGELGRIETELFGADWAAARQRLGREPTVADLGRSAAQRRADALVEMATRSAAVAAGARRPAPLFTVLVGWETLRGRICELAGGTVLAPGALVPWLDEALVERVVFDGPSRVIDVGVRDRFFAGATRRAVQVRDQECFHDYCDVGVEGCQVDHIVPYGEGGLTVQANGRLACGFHNRARHRGPPASSHRDDCDDDNDDDDSDDDPSSA